MSSQEAEKAGSTQPTPFDVSCRQDDKEKEVDGVIHDFVLSLACSGYRMVQADGPLGDFMRYCRAVKTMPTR